MRYFDAAASLTIATRSVNGGPSSQAIVRICSFSRTPSLPARASRSTHHGTIVDGTVTIRSVLYDQELGLRSASVSRSNSGSLASSSRRIESGFHFPQSPFFFRERPRISSVSVCARRPPAMTYAISSGTLRDPLSRTGDGGGSAFRKLCHAGGGSRCGTARG